MTMDNNLKIAITQGDTNGVGLELILKSFSNDEMFELCTPVVYANEKVLLHHRKALGLGHVQYSIVKSPEQAVEGRLNLVPVYADGLEVNVTFGKCDPLAGQQALAAMEMALKDAAAGKVDAVVACPIHLPSMPEDLFPFTGLCDYLSSRLDARGLTMLSNPYMRVALATNHVPLSEVASALTSDLLEERIRQTYQAMERDFLCSAPRVAVLGLNPHAGAAGILGSEETDILTPVIGKLADESNIRVFGPYAADGFFGTAMYRHFDSVLALYHDQGTAPFKSVSMNEGIEYVAGLKVVCTAPSHGPALDRAGKGDADEHSFLHAIYAAMDVCRHRRIYDEAHANPLPPYVVQHERTGVERRRFPFEAQ